MLRHFLALTNLHAKISPLNAEDSKRYNKIKNRIMDIANEQLKKRRRTKKRYRDLQRRRIDVDRGAASHENINIVHKNCFRRVVDTAVYNILRLFE